MSKQSRSGLLALLLVAFVLSLATMGCGGTDGNGGSFLDSVVEDVADFADEVVEGEKQNWGEVGGSMSGSPSKDSGFVGAAGKVLCESRGYTWVASIDACIEKK